MSILNVEHLSHGFGDRAIFQDVSFRLLKGEHIGLVGANGEGKSTFFKIVTDRMMPDEGKIEWAKNVRVGYLDQHAELKKGMTIREVLSSAFSWLYEMEEKMNTICDQMGEASPEEMEQMMEELGTIQDLLTMHDFYIIDAKVEEVARALGLLELGLESDVTELSGGQRTKILLGKLLLEKPDILLLDEPTNYLDVQHIEWLKRYLNEYENAFILISHDIPFLNSVVNIIYHMESQKLDRYVGDYHHFEEVYAVKKAQLEAAYKRQQQEISELKDFVARNKARVSTRNMAMSRQKKLDKMEKIELMQERPKPQFLFKEARTAGKQLFCTKDLVIGYDEPLSSPLNLEMERGEKVVAEMERQLKEVDSTLSARNLLPQTGLLVSQMSRYGGPGSMYHELLTRAGIKNAIAEVGVANGQLLSQELIVKSDPDFFFVSADRESDETGAGKFRDSFLANPAIQNMRAYHRVIPLEDRYIYASSQNCVYAVKAMANAAYGPLFDMSGEKQIKGY